MNPIHKFTSSRLYHLLGSTRKARIVSASAVALTFVAFGAAGVAPLAMDDDNLPVKTITQDIASPNLSSQLTEIDQQDDTQKYVREERIRAGDTLATLMQRLGVDDDAAETFIKKDKTAKAVMQLRTGKRVLAQTDDDGKLLWLRASIVDGKDIPVKTVSITKKGEGFTADEAPIKLERRVEMHARDITSTLFAATDSDADGARLPDAIVRQILEMFSTNIDFRSDVKRGDRFNVVYETFWQDGEMVRVGRILAGEFTNRGTTYQSVWFEDPASKTGGGYYSFDGKALKKAFLKSPLEFTRVSSGFSMRVHPISGDWKAHKGIDFAAPTGTPIRAAGDGVIDFAGTQNGYGNVIVLKHWNNYSTAYAHMSRFAAGVKKGQKVSQGDLIGYVGTTGWSTGAHLHYEFRVGGEAKDPAKLNLLAQAPLTAAEKARFNAVAGDMIHRFALLRPVGSASTLAQK
ncbi:murein DD-endopeptidase MepM/ murein hydrolase activator NlpD [Pseudoduganella lurida]|uniref:Murein DD-endopeptidase MepM/ murein hydrolase activator NlpD n=1 Tax=Pseudoduganella lurida TaxID=1036180 RepID=A0A562R473_9BURK|nr:M23 family metallopeptidase [Pseudoduganella lurida]TWI63643.1 murein DD-endopeptidase MepM/ murein hydrolase activator NlpD [Pseudoduganella lurida]